VFTHREPQRLAKPLSRGPAGLSPALILIPALALPTLALADGKISGKVKGTDGQPIPGIGITLNPESKSAVKLSGKTNKKGEYYFGIVRNGTYTLSVTGTTLVPHTISLKAYDEVEKKNTTEYAGPDPTTPQRFEIADVLVVTYDLVLGEASQSPAALAQKEVALGQAKGEIPTLLQSGDFDGALAKIDQSLATTPGDAQLNYLKGYTLFRQQKYAEAETPLRRALEIDSTQPGAHMILGGVLSALDRKPDALPELQTELGTASDPTLQQNLRLTIGRLQKELGRTPDAIATYEAVLEADPASAEAVAQLMDLYTASGDKAKRDALLARGEAAGTVDPAQLFNLGAEAWNKKDFDGAYGYFQRASRADPKFAPAWKHLGYACVQLGRTDEAVTALQTYLNLAADAPDAAEVRDMIKAIS